MKPDTKQEMIDWLSKLREANREPIQMACRQWLEKAGEDVRSMSTLWAVTLVGLGVEQMLRDPSTAAEIAPSLVRLTKNVFCVEPIELMARLLNNPSGPSEANLLSKIESAESPQAAGRVLIDAFLALEA